MASTVVVSLIPDFFRPVWEQNSDSVYFVLQAAVAEGDLEAYLQGCAGTGGPDIHLTLFDSRAQAHHELTKAAAGSMVPVPLLPGMKASFKLLKGSTPVAMLERDFDTFVKIPDLAKFRSVNQLFEIKRTPKGSGTNDCPPPPESDFAGMTFTQMFVAQLCGCMKKSATAAAVQAKGANVPVESSPFADVKNQLTVAFAMGKTYRLFDDANTFLLDPSLAAGYAGEVMVLPRLLPGEDWHAQLGDKKRQITGIHGMCGHVWPMISKARVDALAAGALPDRIEVEFTATGTRKVTALDGSHPAKLVLDDPAVLQYFTDLKAGVAVRPAVTASNLGHLGDPRKLVFAVNRSVPLRRDELFAPSTAGTTVALPYVCESSATGEFSDGATSEQRRALLDASDYFLASFAFEEAAPPVDIGMTARLLVAVPGKLVPVRKFKHDKRHLRAFAAADGLSGPLGDLVLEALEAPGAKVSLRTRGEGGAAIPADDEIAKRYVALEPVETRPGAPPERGMPVFFFAEGVLDPARLAAFEREALLVVDVNSLKGLAPIPLAFAGEAGRLAVWRTPSWPAQSLLFNEVMFEYTPPASFKGKPFSATLLANKSFDFSFAVSARHLTVPVVASYTETDADPKNTLGLKADVVFDEWNHKALNAYVAPAASGAYTLLNPENVVMPAVSGLVPGSGSARRQRLLFMYRFADDLSDPRCDAPGPATPLVGGSRRTPLRLLFEALAADPQGGSAALKATASFEHHYGSQLFAESAPSVPWSLDYVPLIDWLPVDPTQVRKDLGGTPAGTPAESFVSFVAAGDPGHSKIALRVRDRWLKESTPYGAKARSAARELRLASAIRVVVTTYVFDLRCDESDDGTAHDRPFHTKLRPRELPAIVLTPAQRKQIADRLDMCGEVANDFELVLDTGTNLVNEASLLTCRLELDRPSKLLPPMTAPAGHRLARPRVEAYLSFNERDLVVEAEFDKKFERFDDLATAPKDVVEQYEKFVRDLRGTKGDVAPEDAHLTADRRKALTALTRHDRATVPNGPAGPKADPPADLTHGVLPLAFLPVHVDPQLGEVTGITFRFLVEVLRSFNDLAMDEFAAAVDTVDKWKAFYRTHLDGLPRLGGGRLELAALTTGLAGAMQPIPRDMSPGLVGELADVWRTRTPASDTSLTWPQTYTRALLRRDLGVYADAKSLLVHFMRGSATSACGPLPVNFHAARVRKGVTDTGPLAPASVDVDTFPYEKTTTLKPAGHPNLESFAVADLLDDLTYDHEFAVTEIRYRSGEEFLEYLGATPPPEEFPANGVLKLKDKKALVPLAPSPQPVDDAGAARVQLVARRPVATPQIVLQGAIVDEKGDIVDWESSDYQYLADLDSIIKGLPGPKPSDGPCFERFGASAKTPAWKAEPAPRQIDLVVATVVLAVELDEEMRLDLDRVWIRQKAAVEPAAKKLGKQPAELPFDPKVVAEARDKGARSVEFAKLNQWLEKGLETWMTSVVESAVTLVPETGARWKEGEVRFALDKTKPLVVSKGNPITPEGRPKLDDFTLDPGVPHPAARVSLYGPLQDAGESGPIAKNRVRDNLFLVVVETRLSAGEEFTLAARQARNHVEDPFMPPGPTRPIAVDERFVQITVPVKRPTPEVYARDFDFARQLPGFKPVAVPAAEQAGLDLAAFLDALVANGAEIRRPDVLRQAVARVGVYAVGGTSAPSLAVGVAGPTISVLEVRSYREPVLVFRFNDPFAPAPSRIHVPTDPAVPYRIEAVFTTTRNTPLVTLRNIPIRVVPG